VTQKVWYCPSCGYEVTSKGRCHNCGEKLVASPLPELESGPDDDEVGYRIEEWDDETRVRLIESLIDAGVYHRFEDEELVILAVDEAEVDKIVQDATAPASAPGPDVDDDDEDEDEEPRPSVGWDLYSAAKRLRDDPTDLQADGALGEASGEIFTLDYVPGFDEDQLAAVGRVTRRLLGALGADEALEDEIRHQADVLCRLVAPNVGEQEAAAEAAIARAHLEAAARKRGLPLELPGAGEGTSAGLATAAHDVTAGSAASVASAGGLATVGGPASGGAPAAAGAPAGSVGGRRLEASEDDEVEADEADEEVEDEEVEDEEGTGELVYELGDWLPEQRVELAMLLEAAGVVYRWDGPDLTVNDELEDEVDELFEQVHGDLDEDDEARYRTIEELFGSVDRLANDPGDPERRLAFLEAVDAVEQPTPVGVDDAFWWRVRSQSHVVAAALEGDARNDEISKEAALLAEMLHGMV
jgi:hypothetical protein